MTRAQQRALTELWGRFGIENNRSPLTLSEIFGRNAPLVLEIGFGDGESLALMASANPDMNYLGLEVHRPGIGHLLLCAEQLGLTHLRVMRADAVEILERQLPDESADLIQIFFPDPWPKARHHKRRMVQDWSLARLAELLIDGGELRLATDDEPYLAWMLRHVAARPEFAWLAERADDWRQRPADWPPTRYEQKAIQQGRKPSFLRYRRVAR